MNLRSGQAAVAAACVGSGLLLAASLPPWGWWPLAIPGIALLDWALDGADWRGRFRRGFLAFAVLLVPTFSWMIAFTLPGWLIAAALYSVVFGIGMALLPPSRVGRWIALPGMVVLVDALRGRWPFGGVPTSTLALGQAAGPLAPIARIGGALLITGATAAVGVALVMAVRRRQPAAAIVLGAAAAVAIIGSVAPDGRSVSLLRVAVVQGGGPQGTRAENTDERVVFERHLAASELVETPVDLVLWPEDVVDTPGPLLEAREGSELAALARELDAVLVVGTVEGARVDGESRFHNAAVAFDPAGEVTARFEKVRRVPFGEYTPLRWLLEPIAGDALISSEALPGRGQAVLDTPVGRLGVVISWEVFFGDRGRDAIGNGGSVLLNPTNGASFRTTMVQAQQVAASQLRAIETGRWVLQAAPTGFSAIVTPDGDVVDRTGVSERAVLHGVIERRSGQTIATRVGDWLALALAAAAIGTGWWVSLQLQQQRHGPVVDQLNLHLGAEPTGGDRRAQESQVRGDGVDQRFGHLRWCGGEP